jgi:serralysin
VPSSWQIAGVGDFNGDGKSDILWHNSNGAIAIWDSGVTSHTVAAAGVVPNDWHIIV